MRRELDDVLEEAFDPLVAYLIKYKFSEKALREMRTVAMHISNRIPEVKHGDS